MMEYSEIKFYVDYYEKEIQRLSIVELKALIDEIRRQADEFAVKHPGVPAINYSAEDFTGYYVPESIVMLEDFVGSFKKPIFSMSSTESNVPATSGRVFAHYKAILNIAGDISADQVKIGELLFSLILIKYERALAKHMLSGELDARLEDYSKIFLMTSIFNNRDEHGDALAVAILNVMAVANREVCLEFFKKIEQLHFDHPEITSINVTYVQALYNVQRLQESLEDAIIISKRIKIFADNDESLLEIYLRSLQNISYRQDNYSDIQDTYNEAS
ncbi:MAG: hypothetical protein LBJ64_02740, partial [Deltaproteobacteria bacterium]|nr:hypothetical protein [Deltaproteobacteria bacterium]